MTAANGTDTISYVYDGDGNRVTKNANGVITRYLTDSNNPTGYVQVVEELSGAYAVVKRYAYGHDLISQTDASGSAGTHYFSYDGTGSTHLLTDYSGDIAASYDYDAFGTLIHTLIVEPGTLNCSYLFHGEQYDADLGQYYLRARYMHPGTGRFWTMDEFEGMNEDPASLHKYAFTASNPVNMTDPSGYYAGSMTLGGLSTAMYMRGMLLTTAIVSAAILQSIIERFDEEMVLIHYTTKENYTMIKLSGVLLPGAYTGKLFFTQDEYPTGEMALEKLALFGLANRNKFPTVKLYVNVKRIKDGVFGPSIVRPRMTKYGEWLRGGGEEFYTNLYISLLNRKHYHSYIPEK